MGLGGSRGAGISGRRTDARGVPRLGGTRKRPSRRVLERRAASCGVRNDPARLDRRADSRRRSGRDSADVRAFAQDRVGTRGRVEAGYAGRRSALMRFRAAGFVVALVLSAYAPPTAAQPAALARYAGRPLIDVLQELQSQRLNIVFSSELVTPDMRVTTEPKSTTARKILDELLRQHGLEA